MVKKATTLLIDGDIVLYRQACSVETEVHWGDDIWTLSCDLGEAKAKVKGFLDDLKSILKATKTILALSCVTDRGFRRAVCPTYKHNRNGKRKPLGYAALKEWAIKELGGLMVDRLEADDIMGIESTRPIPESEERIIVTIDKDLRGVPGNIYNFSKMEEGVQVITPDEAERFHVIQTLAGDASDGYSGCPGVGPKTAEKIIAGVPRGKLWQAIVAAYAERGLGEAEALTNARLAHICQFEDYNPKTNSIRLWKPKST
jgi:DNA polymerase I